VSDAPLKIRLQDDMKTAMRAGEKERLGAIRLILAAVKQQEIDGQTQLDDSGIIAVLDKMTRQRKESIDQFGKAGRTDLIDKEQAELDVIRGYMPQPLGEREIERLIEDALQSTGAASIKDMGKVMAVLKPQLQGRADMSQVSARIKSRLAAG
jgi:uncharacterized protein YqeY